MRKVSVMVALIFLVLSFGGTPVLAQEDIQVFLDGQEIVFDQPLVIEAGRALAPVRGILEPLGLSMHFEEQTRTIVAEDTSTRIVLTVGMGLALVNEQYVILDVPAQIINNRAVVPLRFISEAMDLEVNWDEKTRIVTLKSAQYIEEPVILDGDEPIEDQPIEDQPIEDQSSEDPSIEGQQEEDVNPNGVVNESEQSESN